MYVYMWLVLLICICNLRSPIRRGPCQMKEAMLCERVNGQLLVDTRSLMRVKRGGCLKSAYVLTALSASVVCANTVLTCLHACRQDLGVDVDYVCRCVMDVCVYMRRSRARITQIQLHHTIEASTLHLMLLRRVSSVFVNDGSRNSYYLYYCY